MRRQGAYRALKASHPRRAKPGQRPDTTRKELSRLARMALRDALGLTRDEELACDACHELVDRFAELEAAGQDAQELMPLVYLHLEACADCFEEFEALRANLDTRLKRE